MYNAPLVNSYVPMDYPEVKEYVPEPPDSEVLAPNMPIKPGPCGQYLQKDQVINWAMSVLKEAQNEPLATYRLTQLITWLIDD